MFLRRRKVPEVLFTTLDPPVEMAIWSKGCLVQARWDLFLSSQFYTQETTNRTAFVFLILNSIILILILNNNEYSSVVFVKKLWSNKFQFLLQLKNCLSYERYNRFFHFSIEYVGQRVKQSHLNMQQEKSVM